MTFRATRLLCLLGCLAALSAGCRRADSEPQYIPGTFEVREVRLPAVGSLPAEVDLTVIGELPDACTEIDQVTQERAEAAVRVTITTRRPVDQSCSPGAVEHTERVRLGTIDTAGFYTFDVNGQQTTAYLGSLPTAVPVDYGVALDAEVLSADGGLRLLAPTGWAWSAETGEIRVAAAEAALTEEPLPSTARLVVQRITGESRSEDFGLDGRTVAEAYALFAIRAEARVGPPDPLSAGKWTGLGGHGDDPVMGSRDLRILEAADGSLIAAVAYAPPGEWTAFGPLVEAMLESLEAD